MSEDKRHASRVYKAEDAVSWSAEADVILTDIRIVRKWVREIVRSAWWREHYPLVRSVRVEASIQARSDARAGWYWRGGVQVPLLRVRSTSVHYRRAGRYGEYRAVRTDPNAIRLARWVVLHELAHLAAPRKAAHDEQWAAEYVAIVDRFLGRQDAENLAYSLNTVLDPGQIAAKEPWIPKEIWEGLDSTTDDC